MTAVVEGVRVHREVHGPFERITLIGPRNEFGRRFNVCVHRIGSILIDTGCKYAAPALVETLRGRPPDLVLLTHQHEDHIGGFGALQAAFGPLPVYAPRVHVDLVSANVDLPVYRTILFGDPDPILGATPFPDTWSTAVQQHTLRMIETPGHTPGHVAFYVSHAGSLTVVSGDLFLPGEPPVAWFESSVADTTRSSKALLRLAERNGEVLQLLPSHGRVPSASSSALRARLERLETEAARIEAAAQRMGSSPPAVIAEALYGPESIEARFTDGEFSCAAFVRSVLAPTRTLPALPVLYELPDADAS